MKQVESKSFRRESKTANDLKEGAALSESENKKWAGGYARVPRGVAQSRLSRACLEFDIRHLVNVSSMFQQTTKTTRNRMKQSQHAKLNPYIGHGRYMKYTVGQYTAGFCGLPLEGPTSPPDNVRTVCLTCFQPATHELLRSPSKHRSSTRQKLEARLPQDSKDDTGSCLPGDPPRTTTVSIVELTHKADSFDSRSYMTNLGSRRQCA